MTRLEKLDVNKTENKEFLREDSAQLSFFDKKPSEIEEEIKGIDILDICLLYTSYTS